MPPRTPVLRLDKATLEASYKKTGSDKKTAS
jgi:hypothetical protein